MKPVRSPITVEGTIVDGAFKPDQPLAMPENVRARATIEVVADSTEGDDRTPAERWADCPLSKVIGIGEGPPDLAAEHDHYAYGTPKKYVNKDT